MKNFLRSVAATAGLFLLLVLPEVSKAQTAAGPFTIINWLSCPVEVRWDMYCASACPASAVPQVSNGFITIPPNGGSITIPVATQNLAGGGGWIPTIETDVYLVSVNGQPLNISGPTPVVNSVTTTYSAGPGTIPVGNPCPIASMLWSPSAVIIL